MPDCRCDRRRAERSAVESARAFAIATAFSLGLVAHGGCASQCASNCPPVQFDVVATQGENLAVATAQWSGPGCPPAPPNYCAPDPFDSNNTCVRLSIIGPQQGTCRLDLTFKDGRAPYSATAVFGPETHQGCCHGFPVMGPTSATVPPLHPQTVDAGADLGQADTAAGADDAAGPSDTADAVVAADSDTDQA